MQQLLLIDGWDLEKLLWAGRRNVSQHRQEGGGGKFMTSTGPDQTWPGPCTPGFFSSRADLCDVCALDDLKAIWVLGKLNVEVIFLAEACAKARDIGRSLLLKGSGFCHRKACRDVKLHRSSCFLFNDFVISHLRVASRPHQQTLVPIGLTS